MGSFSGKIVLVTGTSSGMGRCAALRLIEEGATVVAAARRADRGEELISEAKAAGGDLHYIATDIADEQSVEALFTQISDRFGRLDGAFNVAGVEDTPGPLADASVEDFDRVSSINARGTWLCLRAQTRMMRAQGHGAIVTTSSISGVLGQANSSIYVASKHAIVGMTRSAALELAPIGVRINCLLPGGMVTEMSARWIEREPDGEDGLARLVPMKRMGRAQEMADVGIFLLSDRASYVTGATIVVDGGLTAKFMPA